MPKKNGCEPVKNSQEEIKKNLIKIGRINEEMHLFDYMNFYKILVCLFIFLYSIYLLITAI